jgi:hypothetical protein
MVSPLCAVWVIENYVVGLEVAKILMGNTFFRAAMHSVKFGAQTGEIRSLKQTGSNYIVPFYLL